MLFNIFKIFYRPIFFFNLKIIVQQLPGIMHTFYNSFLSAFTRHRFRTRNGNERLENYYSLNLAFHINLLHKMHLSRESISHRKTIREIRISRLHRLNGNSCAPGEKFVLRFDIVTIDCPIYCILTGIFSKKGGSIESTCANPWEEILRV